MITLTKAEQITHKHILQLEPCFAERVGLWRKRCLENNIFPYIYCSVRTCQQQEDLHAQGRTKPGPIVTKTRSGHSFHNYRAAIDYVPLIQHPKEKDYWETAWGKPQAQDLYARCTDIAHHYALRPLASETPHLEDDHYQNWKELSKVRQAI